MKTVHRPGERRGTVALQAPVFGRGESPSGWSIRNRSPVRTDETKNEAVRLGKDVRVLHADGGQLIDVEEAPVVDFLAGYAPEGDPVGLLLSNPSRRSNVAASRASR
jgi:hypothetical protein